MRGAVRGGTITGNVRQRLRRLRGRLRVPKTLYEHYTLLDAPGRHLAKSLVVARICLPQFATSLHTMLMTHIVMFSSTQNPLQNCIEALIKRNELEIRNTDQNYTHNMRESSISSSAS